MKILIISQRYYPEDFRINEISFTLQTKGHDVTVLTGLPNYPSGIVSAYYRGGKNRAQTIHGVKIIRTWELGRKKGKLGLALNYVSLAVSSCLHALFSKEKYDLIFVYQISPVFSLIPARICKIKYRIPIYLYCCDLWPESLKAYSIKENSLLFKSMRKISRWLYRGCNRIAITSMPFIDYMISTHGISKTKLEYIPQHAECIYLDMELSKPVSQEICFLFAGNIGKVQDIPCIIHAASKISPRLNFKIHIVGNGSALDESKQIVIDSGLEEKIIFHGRHPLEEMPEFYKIADACLLTLTGENFIGMTIPSKLQGYMAAGKPVIAAINGASNKIITESECGICVKAGDSTALAQAMEDFICNTDNYQCCGINGKNYFKNHFTLDIFMKKLESEFLILKEQSNV